MPLNTKFLDVFGLKYLLDREQQEEKEEEQQQQQQKEEEEEEEEEEEQQQQQDVLMYRCVACACDLGAGRTLQRSGMNMLFKWDRQNLGVKRLDLMIGP